MRPSPHRGGRPRCLPPCRSRSPRPRPRTSVRRSASFAAPTPPPGGQHTRSAQNTPRRGPASTKGADTPVPVRLLARSSVRAYKTAMPPPYGPVAISLDAGLQQEPIRNNGEKLSIPRYVPTSPPQGDTGAVKEAARLLANAQNPLIVAARAARSANGGRRLGELAALL